MKTIDKKDAVRAYLDGKRVEYRKYEEWHVVKSYSMFDQDIAFRLADTDEDAEWLLQEADECDSDCYPLYAKRARAIAGRLLADKARIAELEKSMAVPITNTGAHYPLFDAILAELERATSKFPTWPTDALHAVGVVAEEMGELQREVNQLTYEPHKSSQESVRKEAAQLAAMSLRFLMSLDRYAYEPRPQHPQNKPDAIKVDTVSVDGVGRTVFNLAAVEKAKFD